MLFPPLLCVGSGENLQESIDARGPRSGLPVTVTQGFPLLLAGGRECEEAERIALTLFGLPDRLATFLGLASASCLGMAGVLVLLPPAMCGLHEGYACGDDLESLKGGLLAGVVGPRRLKKRANGPSGGARGRKQGECLWFRQSPHRKGVVALQNQELIEGWPDSGAQPAHLPRQMPFPVFQQATQKLGWQRDQLLKCLAC